MKFNNLRECYDEAFRRGLVSADNVDNTDTEHLQHPDGRFEVRVMLDGRLIFSAVRLFGSGPFWHEVTFAPSPEAPSHHRPKSRLAAHEARWAAVSTE